jgi:hypothetical protein
VAEALTPAARLALQAWVRDGGTLLGWRRPGVDVASAAGLTAVTAADPPPGFQVAGASLRIALDASDPVAWGEQAEGWAFDTGDPVLAANGAPTAAAYPGNDRFHAAGYTVGADALRGTAAVTDERQGSGRVVLFSFDPAFRGYVEGTERLVANALLAPG